MEKIDDYRNINSVDTLSASAHLRRLRDLGLLEQKGRSNATYYVPTSKLLAPNTENKITSDLPGLSGQVNSNLPSQTPQVSPIIGELTPKISASDELEYVFPHQPNHPQQAYRTKITT